MTPVEDRCPWNSKLGPLSRIFAPGAQNCEQKQAKACKRQQKQAEASKCKYKPVEASSSKQLQAKASKSKQSREQKLTRFPFHLAQVLHFCFSLERGGHFQK